VSFFFKGHILTNDIFRHLIKIKRFVKCTAFSVKPPYLRVLMPRYAFKFRFTSFQSYKVTSETQFC
jgi:hypothetical protein